MDIHKPKPWQGVREFLKEYAIIVVGVLTALGAEQAAEALRWRHEVAEARQELRYEVGSDLWLTRSRAKMANCVDRRLDELAGILAVASQTGRLPPLGFVGQPIGSTYLQDAWDAQKSGQAVAHFSPDELEAIGRVYRFLDGGQRRIYQDDAAWTTLQGLSGPGRRLDAATEGRLYEALNEARFANRALKGLPDRLDAILRQTGLGTDFPQINSRNAPLKPEPPVNLCDKIHGAPPPVYGRLP